VRYYCLREIHPFEDSPVTAGRFKESYNANLANGLGNLVSRVMKMAETNGIAAPVKIKSVASLDENSLKNLAADYIAGFGEYNIKKSMDYIWNLISESDKLIQAKQPFRLMKSDDMAQKAEGKACIETLLGNLYSIGTALIPVMPETAQIIVNCLKENKMPLAPLFLRK
jgi:methionyl-tRNA synthetase